MMDSSSQDISGLLDKGKLKVHDMLPQSPPNNEFCKENEALKIIETDRSKPSGLSIGPASGQCNDADDISTESDEAIKEDYNDVSTNVTRNLIHMVKVQDTHSSSSHDHNVDSLALKENMDGCLGLGKSCPCSFCRKAAHMWMDLTFQDTRGRLTELQRSKKRAADQIAKINQEFTKMPKTAKLEFDLMQHWKMICAHTQDALGREIFQTKSDIQQRSKHMEKCKRELESRSNVVPNKPE